MIAQAHFERINRSQNVQRFYSFAALESAPGQFELVVQWGRVGRPGAKKLISFTSCDVLMKQLAELAQKRHLAGFILRSFEGPEALRLEIESHFKGLGLLSGQGMTTAALFYDLPRLEALMAGRPSDALSRIAELRDLLDPGRKASRSDGVQPILPGIDEDLSARHHVRALAGELISRLLVDDPLARQAHTRAMALPADIHGDNVLYFPLPGGLSAMPIYRLVQSQPGLAKLVYTLTAHGVSTVDDLIALPFNTLRTRYGASDDDLAKLRGLLNGLGLRVGGQRAAIPKSRRLAAAL